MLTGEDEDEDDGGVDEEQGDADADTDAGDGGRSRKRKKKRAGGRAAQYTGDDDDDGNGDGGDEDDVDGRRARVFFHVLMASGAMYMAMLLTNWSDVPDADSLSFGIDVSRTSMWIKAVSMFLTVALYLYSLIVSMVCTDRDFS